MYRVYITSYIIKCYTVVFCCSLPSSFSTIYFLLRSTARRMSSLASSSPNKSLLADPYRLLLDVSINKSRKVRGGNYVQLATVDADGKPKCRTIVQRGLFSHNGCSVFKFITDSRSKKVQQIQCRPEGEIVWWFLKTSEQYRISGDLELIGNNSKDKELQAIRKQTWGELRDTAREQFYGLQPGLPLDEDGNTKANNVNVPVGGRGNDGKVLPPPATFLMMLLRPKEVDYLRLTDNSRVLFRLEETDEILNWSTLNVTP